MQRFLCGIISLKNEATFLPGSVNLSFIQETRSVVGKPTVNDYDDEPLAFANVEIKTVGTETISDVKKLASEIQKLIFRKH